MFGAARLALGHVDVLVANHAASVEGTVEEMTAESIDLALAVNVRATLLLVQAFAAGFERSEGGRVILLTSGQGRGPMPREVPYATSKAALSGIVADAGRSRWRRAGSPSTPSTPGRRIRAGRRMTCGPR